MEYAGWYQNEFNVQGYLRRRRRRRPEGPTAHLGRRPHRRRQCLAHRAQPLQRESC
jgi:hypothetical protein